MGTSWSRDPLGFQHGSYAPNKMQTAIRARWTPWALVYLHWSLCPCRRRHCSSRSQGNLDHAIPRQWPRWVQGRRCSGLGWRDSNSTRALSNPWTMSVHPSPNHRRSLPSQVSRLMPSLWLSLMTILIAHRPRICWRSSHLPCPLPLLLLPTQI